MIPRTFAPAPSEREAGFTLIELIVAVSLTGLLLTLAATVINVAGAAWLKGTRMTARSDELARAASVFRRDVQGMQRIVSRAGPTAAFLFSGQSQQLTFVLAEPAYPTAPGLYAVQYGVEAGPDVMLVRRRQLAGRDLASLPNDISGDMATVLKGAFSIRFSYAAAQDSVWLSAWPEATSMPTHVRLEVLDRATGLPALPPVIVKARIDAEVDCVIGKLEGCTVTTGGRLGRVPVVGSTAAAMQPEKETELPTRANLKGTSP